MTMLLLAHSKEIAVEAAGYMVEPKLDESLKSHRL